MRTYLALALILVSTPSHAAGMCGLYSEFKEALEGSQYGETSLGKGMSARDKVVVEIFVGKETFTILATTPASGRTCIIAAGKGWIAAIPVIPGEPL